MNFPIMSYLITQYTQFQFDSQITLSLVYLNFSRCFVDGPFDFNYHKTTYHINATNVYEHCVHNICKVKYFQTKLFVLLHLHCNSYEVSFIILKIHFNSNKNVVQVSVQFISFKRSNICTFCFIANDFKCGRNHIFDSWINAVFNRCNKAALGSVIYSEIKN